MTNKPMTFEEFLAKKRPNYDMDLDARHAFYNEYGDYRAACERDNISPEYQKLECQNLEWQPAETAPKDGNWFVALWVWKDLVPQFETMRYDSSEECECFLTAVDDEFKFTHWLPLSALPPIPDSKKEKKLVIEAGKFYKMRNGGKAFVGYKSLSNSIFPLIGEFFENGYWHLSPNNGWDSAGQYWRGAMSDYDLISEWLYKDEVEWAKKNEG